MRMRKKAKGLLGGRRAKRRKAGSTGKWIVGGLIGGLLVAYLFDPVQGRGRRARLKDMAGARVRRAGREASRRGRYMAGQMRGAAVEAQKSVGIRRENADLDDRGLARKVESEVSASSTSSNDRRGV